MANGNQNKRIDQAKDINEGLRLLSNVPGEEVDFESGREKIEPIVDLSRNVMNQQFVDSASKLLGFGPNFSLPEDTAPRMDPNTQIANTLEAQAQAQPPKTIPFSVAGSQPLQDVPTGLFRQRMAEDAGVLPGFDFEEKNKEQIADLYRQGYLNPKESGAFNEQTFADLAKQPGMEFFKTPQEKNPEFFRTLDQFNKDFNLPTADLNRDQRPVQLRPTIDITTPVEGTDLKAFELNKPFNPNAIDASLRQLQTTPLPQPIEFDESGQAKVGRDEVIQGAEDLSRRSFGDLMKDQAIGTTTDQQPAVQPPAVQPPAVQPPDTTTQEVALNQKPIIPFEDLIRSQGGDTFRNRARNDQYFIFKHGVIPTANENFDNESSVIASGTPLSADVKSAIADGRATVTPGAGSVTISYFDTRPNQENTRVEVKVNQFSGKTETKYIDVGTGASTTTDPVRSRAIRGLQEKYEAQGLSPSAARNVAEYEYDVQVFDRGRLAQEDELALRQEDRLQQSALDDEEQRKVVNALNQKKYDLDLKEYQVLLSREEREGQTVELQNQKRELENKIYQYELDAISKSAPEKYTEAVRNVNKLIDSDSSIKALADEDPAYKARLILNELGIDANKILGTQPQRTTDDPVTVDSAQFIIQTFPQEEINKLPRGNGNEVTKPERDTIEDYVLNKFGGSDEVLKNNRVNEVIAVSIELARNRGFIVPEVDVQK